MPWYFYGREGTLVTPKPPSTLAPGQIVLSPLPYTSTPPDGFLFCNGQSVLKNSYLDLFAEIGVAFGSININEFTLPDFRSRLPRGIISLAQGVGNVSGVGGATSHTHTLGSHTHAVSDTHTHTMPAHTHTEPNHNHDLINHTHTSGTLATGAASPTRNDNDTDEDGPPYQWGTTEPHTHGGNVNGLTGGVNDINPDDGPTSTDGSQAGFGLATGNNSLDSGTSSGNSGSFGAVVSESASNLPPYLTCSFLIKT